MLSSNFYLTFRQTWIIVLGAYINRHTLTKQIFPHNAHSGNCVVYCTLGKIDVLRFREVSADSCGQDYTVFQTYDLDNLNQLLAFEWKLSQKTYLLLVPYDLIFRLKNGRCQWMQVWLIEDWDLTCLLVDTSIAVLHSSAD